MQAIVFKQLYQDIYEMFKPLLLRLQMYKITDSIRHTSVETNTGQKMLSFFGPKIWLRINTSDCNEMQTQFAQTNTQPDTTPVSSK